MAQARLLTYHVHVCPGCLEEATPDADGNPELACSCWPHPLPIQIALEVSEPVARIRARAAEAQAEQARAAHDVRRSEALAAAGPLGRLAHEIAEHSKGHGGTTVAPRCECGALGYLSAREWVCPNPACDGHGQALCAYSGGPAGP